MTGWQPYQQWYPYFSTNILSQFENICQVEMNTPHTVDRWCQLGAICIFKNIDSYTQTELAGAAVMLGLAPATLALLGPSDNSLVFLSSERPLLSCLLAASTATLSVGYPFSRISPLQPLSNALSTPWSIDSLLPGDLINMPWFISPLQYFLAAVATANTVQMSYDITRKTIVSWSCPNWFWVLGWSFVPLFLHTIGMIVFRWTVERHDRMERWRSVHGDRPLPRSTLDKIKEWLLDTEFRPCSGRVLPRYQINYSLKNQLLWWAPRAMSYLQYVMGIAIFSSLLFIPISDAFPIIVRYGLSAVLARCIVGLELQSLKRKNKLSHQEGQMASPKVESTFNLNARTLTVSELVSMKSS
jgi:hypothetical protein